MRHCTAERRHSPIRVFAALLTASAVAGYATTAHPQSVEEFYKGKTISIVAPANPGGSYDLHARLVARHLPKWLPGQPKAVVQNMLGAGGLRSIHYLYEKAPRDGTVLATPVQENVIADVVGGTEIRFKVDEFNWIGRAAVGVDAIFAWHTTGIKTIEDVKKTELVVGATSPASGTMLYPLVMNSIVGTRFKVISGYSNTDARLAVERGETQGAFSSLTTLKSTSASWFTDKKINVLVMIAAERHPEFPAVPTLVELGQTPEEKQVLTIFESAGSVGRSFATTPQVPKDRVDALRRAFAAMLKDPEYLADFAKTDAELAPKSGEELQALIQTSRKVSPDVLARARAAVVRR
jgi:tripartite-type tricarboxylate transporter receptor subunit TctC